jgi:class 3 adenylate cyclase
VEPYVKSLGDPDEVVRLPGILEELVDLGDVTVGRVVQQPGWRWSVDVRPLVGGQWCQARHVGVVLSGTVGVLMASGQEYQVGPWTAYDVPPGHDGFTVGDEPAVMLDWSGLRTIAGSYRTGAARRVVATLLLTDLVDSMQLATRLGDVAWRERLSGHLEGSRAVVDRFGGRVVETTGDGLLATFPAPALALPAAADIAGRATRDGLAVRAGVHVGEVDLAERAVRGVAVHETARIMALAGPGEVLVSDLVRSLAEASGFVFDDAGVHALKGLGERRLFRYRPAEAPAPSSPVAGSQLAEPWVG